MHLSYLMLSLPATEKNAMRVALIRAMEFTPRLNSRQSQWLDQLRGTPSGTVDFGGLTMMEVRGQCSIVTSAVNSRLPTAERGAILARFGVGEQKAEGVKLLMRYARRSCGIEAFGPVYLLAARHYLPKARREGLSLRAIADKHGLSKRAAETAARWMAQHFASLELLGMQRLQAVFLADGLVEEAEDFRPVPLPKAPRPLRQRVKSQKAKPGAAREAVEA
ncbi:hypothetical protein ACI2VH_02845 [Ralstonia nicotianae]